MKGLLKVVACVYLPVTVKIMKNYYKYSKSIIFNSKIYNISKIERSTVSVDFTTYRNTNLANIVLRQQPFSHTHTHTLSLSFFYKACKIRASISDEISRACARADTRT